MDVSPNNLAISKNVLNRKPAIEGDNVVFLFDKWDKQQTQD